MISVTRCRQIARAVLVLFLCAIVIQNAWVTDDAYITFRTIDNWIHGFGLRWNIDERVQTFTHPLWLLLLSFFYVFSEKIFFISIAVSVALSFAAAFLVVFRLSKTFWMAACAITVLVFSKAFVDYSTSGLENPLSHLLVVVFLWVYLGDTITLRRYLLLSLLAGLAVLNRMDTILFFLPALVVGSLRLPKRQAAFSLMVGFLPFIGWELFSLIYYGFPFPNTAYAKLNTNIPAGILAKQGLAYFGDSLRRDPLTLPVIGLGVLLPFVKRDWRKAAVAMGIILYLLYIVKIGGDFMSGRFFTIPLILAVSLLASYPFFCRWWAGMTVVCVLVFVGAFASYPPILTGPDYWKTNKKWVGANGIADERGYWSRQGGLLNIKFDGERSANGLALAGWQMRGQWKHKVFITSCMGYRPYFAGPEIHFLDYYGLVDPLLSRLPSLARNGGWRIGHFFRQLPEGYSNTIESGKNEIRNPDLAMYYDKLSFVVRGPLLDSRRLAEIWRFNTGKYDSLLTSYMNRRMERTKFEEIQEQMKNFQAGRQPAPVVIPPEGLEVELPRKSLITGSQYITRAGGRSYLILYCDGEEEFFSHFLYERREDQFINWSFSAEPQLMKRETSKIRIFPLCGDTENFLLAMNLQMINAD